MRARTSVFVWLHARALDDGVRVRKPIELCIQTPDQPLQPPCHDIPTLLLEKARAPAAVGMITLSLVA